MTRRKNATPKRPTKSGVRARATGVGRGVGGVGRGGDGAAGRGGSAGRSGSGAPQERQNCGSALVIVPQRAQTWDTNAPRSATENRAEERTGGHVSETGNLKPLQE